MKKSNDILIYLMFIISTLIIGIGIAATKPVLVILGIGVSVLSVIILLNQIATEQRYKKEMKLATRSVSK